MKYVKWFKELSREDIPIAGGKGANLGELTGAGVPVPDGFVVLSNAYFDFLDYNKLRLEIHKILKSRDAADPAQLKTASEQIQKLLKKAEIPPEIAREVFESYHKLGSKTPVAVRSSATAEDLPEASFAGQQESYLNILGDANVLLKVKECWMSLFGQRSIFYREQKHFDHFKVGIAVPVQTMVQSEVSGVMFTTDPISQDKNKVVIEAIYGLGDYIVQGVVTPDHYEVSKAGESIIQKQIALQEVAEVRTTQGVKEIKIPKKEGEKQKISDANIVKLAQIGKKIHQHYLFPQDIEWAYAKNKLYITQARPITTLSSSSQTITQPTTHNLTAILTGAPASPGLISGPVKIIANIKNIDRIKAGDIMVTDMTTPDFVPAMKRAGAIITNRGGLTSHAAIVSRELGVPCVVGTKDATQKLVDGMVVTVDGAKGEIYKGAVSRQSKKLSMTEKLENLASEKLHTATKLYVNLAEPDLAKKISAHHIDGVGLLRAEFMIAGIGVHPKKLLAEGKGEQFISKLTEQIATFCESFSPRPVIYRATDFKTNEYRALKGGEAYEPEESNPMLGFRGAIRYIKSPEVFALELEAIKRVRNKHNLKNLWLMIPFVSTVSELVEVKKIVAASGLYRSSNFKLFMMVEIPSNVILLDDFLDVGIDGVSIGSNDLTMLILGTDRDNSEVASQFDERNPAVMWALEKTVRTCAKRGVMCGICGQAPSEYPELVEKLVEWGVTSISVNPDAIGRTRQIIFNAEHSLITKKSKSSS